MEEVMVSVIAVNYNSSALLKECLHSIASTAGDENLEFLVVDSGSREEEVERLSDLERDNVKIILSSGNIGYAKAVNTGIENAKGDVILITNPDVVYKPGSIKAMLSALSELPGCGAVGPKTWWNKRMTFLLPTGELITPSWILKTELMRISPFVSRAILKRWVRKTLRYWLSGEPETQEMLSGACIMTTRRVIEKVGVFDDSFALYFEDTDWCLRARKAGYRLYLAPQAHIVHYYNQSAKQDAGASQEKYNDSMDRYMRKHFRINPALLRSMVRLLDGVHKASARYEDKGVLSEPPVFTFGDASRKLLLLSPVDFLVPSAGAFVEGDSFKVPEDLWGLLGEGRYFVKVLYLETLVECGAWSWEKRSSE
jgi:GT2 family glycosyltransferase